MNNFYSNRNPEILACFTARFADTEHELNTCGNGFDRLISLTGNMNDFSQDTWEGWKCQKIRAGKGRFHTVHDADNRLNLILRGSDNKFWQSCSFTNEVWQAWFSPVNLSQSQLSNISDEFFVERFGKDGQDVLFVRGTDGHLWDFWSNPKTIRTQPWNFNRLPMQTNSCFFAIERTYGGLEAFAIGMDNCVWHSWTMDYDHDKWSQWESLRGCAAGGLYLTNNSEKYPEMLICDPTGQLWTIRHYKDGWHNWVNLGNNIKGGAKSITNSTGGMSVYALGFDHKLYRISRDSLNSDWNNWECLGGTYRKLVGVVKAGDEKEIIGLIGADHQLWIIDSNEKPIAMSGVLQDAVIDTCGNAVIAVGCSFDGTLYCRNL